MINSPAAKAIAAAIITSVLGALGVVTNAINEGTWDSSSTIAVIAVAVIAIGTTLGVYRTPNAEPPTLAKQT